MPNPVITNIDLGELALEGDLYRDEQLAFDGADTVAKGTLLGRRTAGGALFPFAAGAADGSETPVAVLGHPVTRAAVGVEVCRAMIGGVVNQNRLVIHADGDASNVDAVVMDQLRNYGITALDMTQESTLDNQ